MSLVWYDPFQSSTNTWNRFPQPEDVLGTMVPREFKNWISRPWSSMDTEFDSGAQVTFDKNRFNVNVDVQQFKPDEISVKVSDDNTITVEGKHEERPDEHGYISRQFVRRYVLPKDHDVSKVESRLSSDGVLTISAPRTGDPEAKERRVPIKHTGKPSKAIQNKQAKSIQNKSNKRK